MQGFFILVCGSTVFIGVVLMGVWRCPTIPLGYPDLGGWGQQGTAPLQQHRPPGISLPPAGAVTISEVGMSSFLSAAQYPSVCILVSCSLPLVFSRTSIL